MLPPVLVQNYNCFLILQRSEILHKWITAATQNEILILYLQQVNRAPLSQRGWTFLVYPIVSSRKDEIYSDLRENIYRISVSQYLKDYNAGKVKYFCTTKVQIVFCQMNKCCCELCEKNPTVWGRNKEKTR